VPGREKEYTGCRRGRERTRKKNLKNKWQKSLRGKDIGGKNQKGEGESRRTLVGDTQKSPKKKKRGGEKGFGGKKGAPKALDHGEAKKKTFKR